MRTLRTIVATLFILSLAGAALAADLQDASKIRVVRPDVPHIMSTQALDCSGAIEVDLNIGEYIGTTVGAPNNVTTYGCSGWSEGGGEAVYHVTMPDGYTWEVGLSGMTADLDLAVLDSCDETAGCLIVVDSGVYVSEPFPGEFYFVVDGYGTASGPYTLTFTLTEYVAPPTMCELIQDVTGTHFVGDTCDGYNNVQSLDCGTYSEAGLEHYYEIKVPAGCNFTANVTYDVEDGALWVLDGCADGYACLGYADDTLGGETESVFYTNDTGALQSVILVLDSWGADACGTYTFDFESDCAVATEVESFGAVKSMFR